MTAKKVTPTALKVAPVKRAAVVRKAATKTAPVAKAAAPVKRAPAKAATVAVKTPAVPEKKLKKNKKSGGKLKVVRDSFTMPQSEYAKIGELKQLCLKSGMHVKKSELLRAGLNALGKLSAAQLKAALAGLEKIKTGRPAKS